VEAAFSYVETNLLNGRTFTSLEPSTRSRCAGLAETAMCAIHRENPATADPQLKYEEKKTVLLALPARPYDTLGLLLATLREDVELL